MKNTFIAILILLASVSAASAQIINSGGRATSIQTAASAPSGACSPGGSVRVVGGTLYICSATTNTWGAAGGGGGSGITGTLTPNRVTIGLGTSSVQDFSTFTYDNTQTAGNLHVTAAGATHIAGLFQGAASASVATMVVKAGASQTGNIIEADSAGTVNFRVNSSGVPSTPTSGVTESERYGAASVATGAYSLAVGKGATADVTNGTAIGWGAIASGASPTAIGRGASSTSGADIAIGSNSSASGTTAMAIGGSAVASSTNAAAVGPNSSATALYTLAFGRGATAAHQATIVFGVNESSTAPNQAIFGGSLAPINDVYFGKGVAHATPAAYTINGTGGSGTNIAGADIRLAGGRGTGTGVGGSVIIQAAAAGASGTSLNSLSDVAIFRSNLTMALGGTTSSYPMLKRNNADIQVRLADDSGRAGLTASYLYANDVYSGGISSPAQLTANQNDYAPAQTYFLRLSSDASRDITGFSLNQATGDFYVLINVGSNNIVLKHQSASSTSSNRIIGIAGADVTMAANEQCGIMYDGTTQRWRVLWKQ